MASAQSLLILDRDGVINYESEYFIRTPEQWVPIPGSVEAIAALSRAGWRVVVATNQSGVARRLLTERTLEEIHQRMTAEIVKAGGSLAGIFVCTHHPDAGCDCRKPKPGLFKQIGTAFGIELAGVPMIGDSMRDIEAALAVHGRPILVRTGNGRRTEPQVQSLHTAVFDDLRAAAASLLGSPAGEP